MAGDKNQERDELAAQLDAWGAPADIRRQYLAAVKTEPTRILPSNWEAVRLFLGTSTQWRTAGINGAHIGLDYTAMRIVAEAMGTEITEEILWAIRILEGEAITGINGAIKAAR